MLQMNSAESFSASYDEARAKFLAAAKDGGGTLDRFVHPEKGPEGQELSTDVAWFGPRDADRVLVLISGTHGVEGYCGSGAQVEWLRRAEQTRLPKGQAALLIHAINPYGFAWNRRVTHENVDLNRNWIDFAKPLPENRAYSELSDAICPRHWDPEAQQQAMATLTAYAQKHGMPAFQQAVSGGQYTHPKGIFFGGAGPTWSRKTQSEIFRGKLASAAKIAIIDYHTGLGPWGFGEQIVPVARDSEAFKRAARWYGSSVTSPSGGTSTSADISGDGLSAAAAVLPHAEVTGLALEIGTLAVMDVLGALRADAWLHGYGEYGSPQWRAIKKQMRDAFYGDQDDWKGMVAGQSLLATRQAVTGLQRS
jgi:hypothetical protein